MGADILTEPPPTDSAIPEDAVFDPAALDPSLMMGAGRPIGKADPTPEPDKPEVTPASALDPATLTAKPPEPVVRDSDEPRNVAELRRIHKQAKADRDQFKTERDSLAAKLAEIEPKATGYEKEREDLQKRLDEREAAIAEKDAALRRTSARELPEWKEKAEAIHAAAKSVDELLDLPELKEAGLTHTMETLLNPNAKAALNETLRVLNDAGKYAEAQDLMEAHRSVQVWRSELRKIEASSEDEAKTWQTQREATLANTLRGVREGLAAANPIHDMRSPEYLALPKEGQDFLAAQHKAAAEAAQRVISLGPEALAADAYQSALAVRLQGTALKSAKEREAAVMAENADLKAKLATYEKAAGGSELGGTRGGGPTELERPEDIAASLDPVNLPGYRGMRG